MRPRGASACFTAANAQRPLATSINASVNAAFSDVVLCICVWGIPFVMCSLGVFFCLICLITTLDYYMFGSNWSQHAVNQNIPLATQASFVNVCFCVCNTFVLQYIPECHAAPCRFHLRSISFMWKVLETAIGRGHTYEYMWVNVAWHLILVFLLWWIYFPDAQVLQAAKEDTHLKKFGTLE